MIQSICTCGREVTHTYQGVGFCELCALHAKYPHGQKRSQVIDGRCPDCKYSSVRTATQDGHSITTVSCHFNPVTEYTGEENRCGRYKYRTNYITLTKED